MPKSDGFLYSKGPGKVKDSFLKRSVKSILGSFVKGRVPYPLCFESM